MVQEWGQPKVGIHFSVLGSSKLEKGFGPLFKGLAAIGLDLSLLTFREPVVFLFLFLGRVPLQSQPTKEGCLVFPWKMYVAAGQPNGFCMRASAAMLDHIGRLL